MHEIKTWDRLRFVSIENMKDHYDAQVTSSLLQFLAISYARSQFESPNSQGIEGLFCGQTDGTQ